MKRIAVLVSGRGTNFAAIVKAVKERRIHPARIAGLLTNNPETPALGIATRYKIPTEVVDSEKFRVGGKLDREAYERKLVPILERWRPDLVCLAGYLLLVGPLLLSKFKGKMINIHPSLLPSFKGLNAIKQALDYGVHVTGCTVHWVNENLDGGPIIAQNAMKIRPNDTELSLSARLLKIEHRTYVDTIATLVRGGQRKK